jgi:DNA-binding MurR/RpiR family transcriptional regulator
MEGIFITNFIEECIRNAKLTQTEAMIAEYVLKHQEDVYFMTAVEIAEKLGVSDTSVIRTVRAMGFSGFADFQKAVQSQMKQKMQSLSEQLSPKNRLLTTLPKESSEEVIPKMLERITGYLNTAFLNNGKDKLEKVVNILLQSEQKYIFGYRGSSCVASFLGQKIRLILPGVHILTTGDNEMIERIADISNNDCLLVCSFPRYNRMALEAIEIASRAGAKIIALTDKVTSPVARKADLVLTAEVDIVGFSNSYVVPLFLCDLILVMLSQKINVESNKKMNLIEEYVQKLQINFI